MTALLRHIVLRRPGENSMEAANTSNMETLIQMHSRLLANTGPYSFPRYAAYQRKYTHIGMDLVMPAVVLKERDFDCRLNEMTEQTTNLSVLISSDGTDDCSLAPSKTACVMV